MADAPAHHIFVLLGPVDETSNILPDIFCFIQVCLEGHIAKESAMQSLKMGYSPLGDQIPWKFCREFMNTDFPQLSGIRIVRIAVHLGAQGHGYGSAALDQVTRYYEGKFAHLGEIDMEENSPDVYGGVIEAAEKILLLEEVIKPRKNLPPLLVHPCERFPEKVDYIGASFGLNKDLFRFWKKHKFTPFYICDTPNCATGEHSCMVLKPLETGITENDGLRTHEFLAPFFQCFKTKFIKHLPLCYKGLDYLLAMSILDPKIKFTEGDVPLSSKNEQLVLTKSICSLDELKLFEAYTNNHIGYDKVMHLLPPAALYYFLEKLPITLSHVEASLLLSMGLQHHGVAYVQDQMRLETHQILHIFRKVVVKFYHYFRNILTEDLNTSFPQERMVKLKPHPISVDEDLNDGAKKEAEKMRMEDVSLMDQENMLGSNINDGKSTFALASPNPDKLLNYSIKGTDEFQQALQRCSRLPPSGVFSVKSIKHGARKPKKP